MILLWLPAPEAVEVLSRIAAIYPIFVVPLCFCVPGDIS